MPGPAERRPRGGGQCLGVDQVAAAQRDLTGEVPQPDAIELRRGKRQGMLDDLDGLVPPAECYQRLGHVDRQEGPGRAGEAVVPRPDDAGPGHGRGPFVFSQSLQDVGLADGDL
jgi:hypothetical protein